MNKGLEIYALVIMSYHHLLHLLTRTNKGTLSDTIGEMKSFTGKKILNAIITESESQKEWMLNLFEFSAKTT